MRRTPLVYLLLVLGALMGATGCQTVDGRVVPNRYISNRYYDFRDMLNVGLGVTTHHSVTGPLPPSIGFYGEATDLLHAGLIVHNGLTGESDLRGGGAYYESRWRMGVGPFQAVHINQDYEGATYQNYFKTPGTLWEKRMGGRTLRRGAVPAKDLTYSHWAKDTQYGYLLRHRGYEHWAYAGFEAAASDPLLTHFGLMVRAGVDFNELPDFLLGWFLLDYKHDDLTGEEHREMNGVRPADGATEEDRP